MSSSFEKINYNLRPNKCIERKMMSEALLRLVYIDSLKSYRYIGFGSPYFADFILFHKNLGINDLLSIEKEDAKKSRFEFNIPYAGIEMKYGHSSTILPNCELNFKKNIIWLDYDDKISDYMFSDIDTFISNTMAGSFFICSVNVEQDFLPANNMDDGNALTLKDYRLDELIKRVGKNRLPIEFMDINMNTNNLKKVVYEMINRQVKTSLLNRRGKDGSKIYYKQIFHFSYKDNATILTIGGLLYNSTQRLKLKKMAFENFAFTRSGSEIYNINCPNLTLREIKALDKALPDSLEIDNGKFKNDKLQSIPLIQNDIKNYASIYRYYPNFTEVNL